jgi:hypothetical protein
MAPHCNHPKCAQTSHYGHGYASELHRAEFCGGDIMSGVFSVISGRAVGAKVKDGASPAPSAVRPKSAK